MILKCELCGSHDQPTQVITVSSSKQLRRCKDIYACAARVKTGKVYYEPVPKTNEEVNDLLYGER